MQNISHIHKRSHTVQFCIVVFVSVNVTVTSVHSLLFELIMQEVIIPDLNKARVLDVTVEAFASFNQPTTAAILYEASENLNDSGDESTTAVIIVTVVLTTVVLAAGIAVLTWFLCLRCRKDSVFIRRINNINLHPTNSKTRVIRVSPEASASQTTMKDDM